MINWAYFPRSSKPTELSLSVVNCFSAVDALISSENNTLNSNEVLAHIEPHLSAIGFTVETGKKKTEKVTVPVLYGNNGRVAKAQAMSPHRRPLCFRGRSWQGRCKQSISKTYSKPA
ncbi:MAG: hypothetical protein R3E67_06810 [Pseudomonadales bacterium]